MPQQPGGGTGGDPNQANLIQKALAQAGIRVPLEWIVGQMEGGALANAIVALATEKFGGTSGSGGGGGDLPLVPSGGGTGGGGGGSAGPTPAQLAAMRSNYQEILRRWGIRPTEGGLQNLIDHAVDSTWSSTQFMQAVRQTKAYHQQFAGIQWTEGMSEGSYLSKFAAYKGMAQDQNVHLTKQQFGLVLKKGIDTREWSFRLKALESLNSNKPLLDWYESVLRANGDIKPNEQLSKKERFAIVTKQNSQKFEKTYQEAWMSYNLGAVGVSVGKHGKDFTRGELNSLIKQVESGTPGFEVESLGAKDFAQLAATIQEVMPLSQLYGKGVTKRDLAELTFGGKGAPKIAERVKEIMAQFNLSKEDKANAQLIQTGPGRSTLNYGGLAGETGQ